LPAVAVQVALSLFVGSPLEVAVTVIIVESPSLASLGTVTLTVTVVLSPARIATVGASSCNSHP
jgi:hypothetical protein